MALNDLMGKIKSAVSLDEAEETEEYDDGEWEDALEPDPVPARKSKPKETVVKKEFNIITQIPKRTKALEQKIEDRIYTLLINPSMLLTMVDPVCGGALAKQAEAIAHAMVPIVLRNPTMYSKLMGDEGGFIDYMMLGGALLPIGVTVYKHHVSKSIDHNHEEEEDNSVYTIPEYS